MRFRIYGFLIIFYFVVIASMPSPGFALNSSEVQEGLMCDCGCGQVLNACTCERAEQMRALIKEKIDEGKTKEEILGFFVAQSGETILSSPPKKGFNFVVYIFPFVGLVLGGIIAFVIVRKWSGARKGDVSEDGGETESLMDDGMKRKIDNEIEKLEEE